MMLWDDHSWCSWETTKTLSLWTICDSGRLEAHEEEPHPHHFCMLSNILQAAVLCQMIKQESDACRSKLILSKRSQKTSAQIKAQAEALRSPSEKAKQLGKKEKRGSVLSCLIIHFRQFTTNYLPFSSICPSDDRKANVWQDHSWVGKLELNVWQAAWVSPTCDN